MNSWHARPRALRSLLVAGVLTVTAGSGAWAAPAEDEVTPLVAFAACDPSGPPTASDGAIATQLNGQLRAKLRGAMTAYRVSCARMIVRTVKSRGLAQRAAVIAITTAIVESGLQNYAEAVDHDSLGLFQQRASWGSAAERTNPTWATNAFLNKMVREYPDNRWQSAPIGEVCQAVQVSAFPDRYQPQAGDAQLIVNALWSGLTGNRVGILKTDGSALVKEGSLGAAWTTQLPSNVRQVAVSGDRIGVLRSNGEVLFKDGALNSGWQGVFPAGDSVTRIAVTDNRIGILKTDGSLLVKEGAANSAWTVELPGGVTQFALAGNRIGALRDGSAMVKEGALNAGWSTVMPGGAVLELALGGDRIAILKSDRSVLYKDGPLSAAWQGVFPGSNNVTQIAVTDNRIGILKNDGSALVKEGAASSAWAVELPGGVTELDLFGNRIGVLRDGSAMVKEGALNAGWSTVMPGGAVTQLTLG